MNTEYDPPAEDPDANRRIVSGSVLDRFGDTSGGEDRLVTGRLADRDDPEADEPRHPLSGTLADPDDTEPDETDHPLGGTNHPLGGTTATPDEPDSAAGEETDAPLAGTTATTDEPYASDEAEPALAGTTTAAAAADEPVAGAGLPEPGTAFGASGQLPHDLAGPLIGDAAGLRSNWQHLQAGFVDDPRAAVGDAADLVEHAAQAFVGALQQRQRALRDMWSGETGDSGTMDTERLRQALRRYRALFDEICPPQP